jgi:galactokinase
MTATDINNIFEDRFGIEPTSIVFAPGRANIIGEHTDYNQGFVLPFAINQGISMLASNSSDDLITIYAANFGEKAEISLDGEVESDYDWLRFFVQVIKYCPRTIEQGMAIVFGGNLPIGGGVSSSSSLTCAFIQTLNKICKWDLSADDILNIAIDAETGIGVRGGIMDQYTIINANAGKAIFLDCRNQETKMVSMPKNKCTFVLINTNVKHNLINTDYNNRRAECESAIALLNQKGFFYNSARDIKLESLTEIKDILDDRLFNRISFVVNENERVNRAVEYMQKSDADGLGSLLYASHDGLSCEYEVSCAELDWIVDRCRQNDRVFGARMMGGGFGGCVIAYIQESFSKQTTLEWNNDYKSLFGIDLSFIEISSGNGMMPRPF